MMDYILNAGGGRPKKQYHEARTMADVDAFFQAADQYKEVTGEPYPHAIVMAPGTEAHRYRAALVAKRESNDDPACATHPGKQKEDPPAQHDDGPGDEGKFWHDGIGYTPSSTVSLLLECLYGKQWVTYQTVGDQVWGNAGTAAPTIETLQTRTNRWFRSERLPYFVSRGRRRLILKITLS